MMHLGLAFLGVTYAIASGLLIAVVIFCTFGLHRRKIEGESCVNLRLRNMQLSLPSNFVIAPILLVALTLFILLTVISWQAALIGGLFGAVGSKSLFTFD